MGVCRQYRIPHSQLMGGDGRWSQLDVDKAIAHERTLAERCPSCGTFEDDWYYRDDQGRNRHLEEPLWVATLRRCPGCEELARVRRHIREHDLGVTARLVPFGTDEPVQSVPTTREVPIPEDELL